MAALFLPVQAAPAAEPFAVVLVYEASGPDVLPAHGQPARALLSGLAASMTANARGADGTSGEILFVIDADSIGAEALRDPTAGDDAILAALRHENENGFTKVDVLVRASLQAFAAQREGGTPEELDLHLRVDVSMRDVASGRPLDASPRRKLVPITDCGPPMDVACIRTFVADAAGSLGGEVGATLPVRLAALLPPPVKPDEPAATDGK